MQRKIRVLVGKPGLDGHDRGAKVVAAALRDAGMEVIYTGLHQTPEQVVEAAVQEDVDVVALSILSGAHMTLFPDVLELMNQRGVGDRLLTGGGIIPAEDMETLSKLGVGRLFGPGSSTQDIATYIRAWFVEKHGADSLAPAPARVALSSAPHSAAFSDPSQLRPTLARPAPPRAAKAAVPAKAAKPAGAKKAAKRAAPKRTSAKRRAAPRRKPVAKRAAPKRKAAARRARRPAKRARRAGSAARR
jgi:methylmalonyl-CoA mutase C-terminal domain/subunit